MFYFDLQAKKERNKHDLRWNVTIFIQCKQLLNNSSAQGECGGAPTKETVEKWPDADKVDFLWHLDDLTEDHRLSPQIGIRYSWTNGALNLLISLNPSLDHTGLFRFLSSQCATQLTPWVHAYYSINDKYSRSGFMQSSGTLPSQKCIKSGGIWRLQRLFVIV